jgi:hypothetical protein
LEPAAAPLVPTSFIDKYRHLLEEDRDAEPSPRLSRPLLDEEYLSPASSEASAAPEDESDEALEAYMSNLMRRVRGDASTAAVAASAAARFLEMQPKLAPATVPLDEASPREAEDLAIEVDANGMLRLARKQPVSTNLAALRELANTSARTAIARHRQRRHAESAVTKSIICIMGSGASAYLLLTSPDTSCPSFWGGCVTLAIAAVSGAQLVAMAWQGLLDRRRFSAATALDAMLVDRVSHNDVRPNEPDAAARDVDRTAGLPTI